MPTEGCYHRICEIFKEAEHRDSLELIYSTREEG